jgi:hypothetical protein
MVAGREVHMDVFSNKTKGDRTLQRITDQEIDQALADPVVAEDRIYRVRPDTIRGGCCRWDSHPKGGCVGTNGTDRESSLWASRTDRHVGAFYWGGVPYGQPLPGDPE